MLKHVKNTNQISLWQFKMVINSNDVRYLLILDNYETLPEVDTVQLENAWYDIYHEFSEIVGGNRSDLWLLKQRQLIFMTNKYEIDASLLRVIKEFPHPELLELTKEFGYEITLDDFEKTFEKAYVKLMRTKNQIKSTKKELDKRQTKKEDFDGLIVLLEKFQGYQFNEQTMTVKKFANIYKAYKQQNG